MQQIQINPISGEAFEAALTGGHGAVAARIFRKDLRNEKHFVTSPADRICNYLFGAAVAVHLGGVDQRHAQIQSELQGCDFLGVLAAIFSHSPGTLAQGGDAFAGA